jgi:hypothetical protein
LLGFPLLFSGGRYQTTVSFKVAYDSKGEFIDYGDSDSYGINGKFIGYDGSDSYGIRDVVQCASRESN